MLEPKYDEDTVNLGYLKKVISDTEKNIDDAYKNVSRYYASRPQPPYYKGDTWIDGDIVYTCINTRTIGFYQDSDWVTESGAKTEAERKNKTYISQPSNYNPGDMWILQSDEDHRAGKKGEILISTAGRKEYDSDDWINMLGYGTIKSINEVAGNLNNAIKRIGNVEEAIQDGLIITFYQDTVPEGIHLGDLWYVTGEVEGYTKGKIYRYDGINWIILNDPTIQEAFDEANEARLVADGKIQSFYSATEPTQNMGVGDLWIDLSNNNQLYRYNGTNWVAVYDTRINELVTTVETVTERVATIETDLGEIDLKVQENTTSITIIKGNVEDIQDNIVSLQAQIDGAIQFWNGSEIPTAENYPASEWITEADKNNHRADIYTVIEDIDGELKQGKSYRFDKVGDTWQWIELTDNELSAVQALATSKAKVFIATPTVPYSVGDLWLNNGKLYRCKTAKDSNGTYSLADWEIAVNYTDDTVAELAKTLANNAQNTADSAVEGVNNITNTKGEAEGKNIHLTDSAEEPLVDISLHGESTQNGTPTPDNRVEIENIEGNIEFKVEGKNLFDKDDTNIITGKYINSEGLFNNSNSWGVTGYIKILPNKEYISWGVTSMGTNPSVNFYDKDRNYIGGKKHNTVNPFVFITPESCVYIRESFYLSDIETFMIEEGSEPTMYEPYKEQTVYFPLGEEKLMEGSYLADDGIHHIRKQVILGDITSLNSGTLLGVECQFAIYTFPDAKNTGRNYNFVSNRISPANETFGQYKGYRNGKQLLVLTTADDTVENFNSKISGSIVEYELVTEEIVPYTAEQQEAWDKIRALMTYKNVTNITSTAYAKVTYMRDNGLDVYETKQNAQKKYTETSEKLAEQKMTVDGVITQVSDTNKRLTNDYLTAEQVNAELDTTKENIEIIKQNQVTMSQTSKNLQIAIDTINNEGVSKVKTSMGYTFDDEGFKLNRSNAETGTIIDEAAVQVIDKTGASEQNLLYAGYVKEGNTEYQAYIGQTIVAGANMIVRNYLVVPNSRFEEYTNPVLGGKGTGVFEI